MNNSIYNSEPKDICGSYLIVADINDEEFDQETLAKNDRLFGANDNIAKTVSNDRRFGVGYLDFLWETNSDGQLLPKHRYGAIELNPSDDSELKALYKLIFEYLEAYANNIVRTKWCWNCSYTDLKPEKRSTSGNKDKYYSTCPLCGDQRVITHCEGLNHLIIKYGKGNFHCRDKNKKSPWAFVCPRCGGVLQNY